MTNNVRGIVDQISRLPTSGDDAVHIDDINELTKAIETLRQGISPAELPDDLVVQEATPNRSG